MTRSGMLNAARTSLLSPCSGPSGALPVMIIRRAKAGVEAHKTTTRLKRMTRRMRSSRKVEILIRRAAVEIDYQSGRSGQLDRPRLRKESFIGVTFWDIL